MLTQEFTHAFRGSQTLTPTLSSLPTNRLCRASTGLRGSHDSFTQKMTAALCTILLVYRCYSFLDPPQTHLQILLCAPSHKAAVGPNRQKVSPAHRGSDTRLCHLLINYKQTADAGNCCPCLAIDPPQTVIKARRFNTLSQNAGVIKPSADTAGGARRNKQKSNNGHYEAMRPAAQRRTDSGASGLQPVAASLLLQRHLSSPESPESSVRSFSPIVKES